MHVVDIKERNNNNNRHIFPCEKRLITLKIFGKNVNKIIDKNSDHRKENQLCKLL